MATPPRIIEENQPVSGAAPKLRRLVLIRHGHALQSADDKTRVLSDAGRHELLALSTHLGAAIPQRLVCSSATRTRQSAEVLQQACALTADLELQSGLYLAGPEVILDSIRATPRTAETCWVVGHNPGLSEVLRLLSNSALDLSTGEAAILRFHGEWNELPNCPCSLATPDGTELDPDT